MSATDTHPELNIVRLEDKLLIEAIGKERNSYATIINCLEIGVLN
jgi:hypothetical protein